MKRIKTIQRSIFIGLFVLLTVSVQAQTDTLAFPSGWKRNAIKWNMTPYILWSSRDINLSYERILKPYRSFSVNVGYFELPVSDYQYDTLYFSSGSQKGGFSVSGDYRFYFKNRNRKLAPDGLYWGFYGSYHYTRFGSDVTIHNNDVGSGSFKTRVNFSILSAGAELGYQFTIKKHFTVDLVFMGPSLSVYTGKILLDGKIDIYNEEYEQAIRDALLGKIPFLDALIKKGEVKGSGATTSMGLGLRYLIQIGYRF